MINSQYHGAGTLAVSVSGHVRSAKRARMRGSGRGGGSYGSSLERRVLVALVCIKIFGLITVFDPTSLQPFEAPKSLFSRALMWPTMAVLLLALARFGRAAIPASRLHVGVAAFVAASAIAAVSAEEPATALYGERTRYLGLTFVVDMAVLYLTVATAFRSSRDWVALGATIMAGSLVALVYALLQRLEVDPVAWIDPGAFGTLGNSNILGHLLAVVAVTAVCLAVLNPPTVGRGLRAVATALAVLVLFAIALVGTRGALIGTAVGLLVPLALWSQRARVIRRPALMAVSVVVVAAAVLGLGATGPGQRLIATVQGAGASDRLLLYGVAIDAIGERPILGYGPDGFGVAYAELHTAESRRASGGAINTSAHSWLLQTAATTGLVGASVLLGSIGAALATLWKQVRRQAPMAAIIAAALASYLVTGLVSVGSVGVDWILWVAFGGTVALSGPATVTTAATGVASPRTSWMIIVLTVTVGLVGGAVGWSALQASREASLARVALSRHDVRLALAGAQEAVRLDPGRASYWNLLGLAYGRLERWRQAGDAFERATALYGHDGSYWSNLAHARARQWAAGDRSPPMRDSALNAARRAAVIDRFVPHRHPPLAEAALLVEAPEAALEFSAAGLRLAPGSTQDEEIAAHAALASGDAAAARDVLEDVLQYRDTWTLRMALAALSAKLGDTAGARLHSERAQAVAKSTDGAPPRVRGAAACAYRACFYIYFEAGELLLADGSARSVTNPLNYTLNGVPLPTGTALGWLESQRQLTVELPSSGPFPRPGDFITVRGVVDRLSRPIAPDPTTASMH